MRSAAATSASRCCASRASNAASNAAGPSSSAATERALMRSNKAVYSSTAASPRARTSTMILATEASIASSWAVLTAVSRPSAAAKSAADESRRRISVTEVRPCCVRWRRWRVRGAGCARRAPGNGVQQRLERVALELERRWIDDQSRAYRHNIFHRDQIVGPEGIAAADQIDDGIGKSHQRRELHRSVEPDQVDLHAFGREMLACGQHIFGRHGKARAALERALVVEAGFCGGHPPGGADAEIDRLIQALPTVLQKHVLAGDAQIGGAALNVGGDIGCANDDEANVRMVAADDELARGFRILG